MDRREIESSEAEGGRKHLEKKSSRQKERKEDVEGGGDFSGFSRGFLGDFLPRYINKIVPTVFLK